ncbi:IS630 family transposase [Micromonospora inositola]|uniref:Transposase n=1 Tax=Micromonospora inositola TaxID=47865 RepID=A0A1C5K5Q7_9ACTN|nr:IS630 family transposase [Micromonospora inositola]SCG77746.1 Transposase [Micromonospora inositola]
MAEPVRVRRLSDQEGQQLLRITRRGTGSAIRLRRAIVVLASAGGNTVPAIARLVQADEDSVRQVIHRFNDRGMASLDPQWAGGRPRLISPDDEAFIITTATTRPEALGLPFTRWSLRKLADHLVHDRGARRVQVSRERLRLLLREHGLTFQRTKTWKESTDPDRDAKLARIEEVTSRFPDRVFAFDEFGPLAIRPHGGASWAPAGHPDRLPANYRKLHGVRQFHGCYSLGDDQLWGVVRQRKSAANTLTALKSIRAARPDGAPIYVILDNLSAHKGVKIRAWAARNRVELCFTPTYASWANPIEAQFGPLRTFVIAGSNHPNHPVLARKLHAHLRWRNANARHPDVLAAQRRERARIRSERQHRWGQTPHGRRPDQHRRRFWSEH